MNRTFPHGIAVVGAFESPKIALAALLAHYHALVVADTVPFHNVKELETVILLPAHEVPFIIELPPYLNDSCDFVVTHVLHQTRPALLLTVFSAQPLGVAPSTAKSATLPKTHPRPPPEGFFAAQKKPPSVKAELKRFFVFYAAGVACAHQPTISQYRSGCWCKNTLSTFGSGWKISTWVPHSAFTSCWSPVL